jgi:hypothetical protein
MTTIAWKGHFLAADSLSGSHDCRCEVSAVKMRVEQGTVYAITGYFAWFDAWIAWHKAGCDPHATPVCKYDPQNTGNFIVFEAGRCFLYSMELPYPDEQFAPTAFGSGRKYAIGAMLWGASAKDAVGVAIHADPGSGGPVQVIDLLEIQKDREAA